MKYLVLLNRRFPYKYGEAFLENEIDEISLFFDRVIILPSDMREGDPITRKIRSKNVDVIPFEKKPLKLKKIGYVLGGIPFVHLQEGKSLKQSLLDSYFNAACKEQFDKICKILDSYSFGKNDEVLIYSYWLYISAKVAVNLRNHYLNQTNIRCVSRAHAFDIYEDRKYLPEREYILRGIDMVFPCSDNGTKYLQNKYPEYSKKIRTSYLGTYDRGISERKENKKFKIVSCSRVAPEKRIELIIDSLASLRDSGIQLSWTHFGGGEGFEEIKKKAGQELDFMEVHLTGSVSNTEILQSYAHEYYQAFINASSSEGLPVSIMEAGSFGIPVIATDVGGTSEIVVDEYNGFLVDKDVKPDVIADRIRQLAEMDQATYVQFRANARTHWEKHFEARHNYTSFSEQLLQLF